MDQDDVFLRDSGIISRRLALLRGARDRNKKKREDARKRLGMLKALGRKRDK